MSHRSVRGRRRAAMSAVVVAALVAGLAGACGGSGEDTPAVVGGATLVPSSTGATCSDPTGDLDLPVGVTADAPGISGVDLVSASATVGPDTLDISFTTAGPVDAAPAATYVVAQGEPLGALSFEVRLVHDTDGWTTTLITWPDAVEDRRTVPSSPKVDGSTVATSLPLSSLPPISSVMQFGATATVGDLVVVDDCSSLTSS